MRLEAPVEVRDVMTPEVVTCGPEETLCEVAERMFDADVACLPVVEGGTVVGVLSDRDICGAATEAGRGLEKTTVREAMSQTVHWCWPRDAVEAAEAIMRAHGVRRLPVIEPSGALVGVVSLADIATAALLGGGPAEPPRAVVETRAGLSHR